MGFNQTPTHKNGKGSFHQIGLVRGQFGNVPMEPVAQVSRTTPGFDGWEEASWELDLRPLRHRRRRRQATPRERVDLAKKHGLEIFTVAAHLQGQALGDEPTAKTLQFVGGEAVEAYKAWRDKGNNPPRTDPYFVPPEVGKLIHAASPERPAGHRSVGRPPGQAAEPQGGRARLRRLAGRLLEPLVPVPAAARRPSAATRSPTSARSAWSCWSSGSARSATCASNTA